MEIPKNVTVMIDAGAVVKLRQANIEVGSSEVGIDRSGGALQVLGTPQDLVYFTSYQDATIGKNDNSLATAAHPPMPGDWGGLVFESDLDNAYNAANPGTSRTDYEQEGIFLDYVNHAAISYGGGSLLVNSVRTVFDPIYMTDTRITASYNTISKSADAAMSADPNTFQESEFEGNPGVGSGDVYTADYNRVGPELDANLLVGNSINGLLVRIRHQCRRTAGPVDGFRQLQRPRSGLCRSREPRDCRESRRPADRNSRHQPTRPSRSAADRGRGRLLDQRRRYLRRSPLAASPSSSSSTASRCRS